MSKNIKVKKRKFDTSSMQNDKECSSAEVEQIEDTILEEELKAEKKKMMIWKNKLSALFASRFREQARYLSIQTVILFVSNAKDNLAQRAEQSWGIIDLSLQSRLLKEFC